MERISHITKLSKQHLLSEIVQSINECGFNVMFLTSEYPFSLRIYNENERYNVLIYIWNISHGGGYKRAANEYRIQISGVSKFLSKPNTKTLILGYWHEIGVFAGFNFKKHHGDIGRHASFQIKQENLETAAKVGFSPCDKGNGEIAIAFSPDFFVEYVRSLESLHTFGESSHDFTILKEITESEATPNNEVINKVNKKRQKTLITVSKTQRDNKFREKVLRAYKFRCAFSGIQLKLIDAAHIVPVYYETSTDDTCNGIALSALHHRAYDKGLVTFNEDYRIVTNPKELLILKNQDLVGGLDKFMSNIRPVIDVPPAKSDRPNTTFIKTANSLRGW